VVETCDLTSHVFREKIEIMSNIIPTLGASKNTKSTDAPGKARPNISKLISDDIFIENEFDLSCLMGKIPKKKSVLEKDDVWSFTQTLSQLIVEIENERSHQPTNKN